MVLFCAPSFRLFSPIVVESKAQVNVKNKLAGLLNVCEFVLNKIFAMLVKGKLVVKLPLSISPRTRL